jgi:hypothetical protein
MPSVDVFSRILCLSHSALSLSMQLGHITIQRMQEYSHYNMQHVSTCHAQVAAQPLHQVHKSNGPSLAPPYQDLVHMQCQCRCCAGVAGCAPCQSGFASANATTSTAACVACADGFAAPRNASRECLQCSNNSTALPDHTACGEPGHCSWNELICPAVQSLLVRRD